MSTDTTRGRKDAWKYAGGANTWSEFAIDEKRGIAYFPLGSPTYDLYGADRIGADLFGNCLLALDARTGKRIWHFQTVHHDLWDYDLVTGPKLLTVRHDGKMVDIVAQPGKTGFLYVLEPGDGRAVVADRRASGPEERCARRAILADATLSRPNRRRLACRSSPWTRSTRTWMKPTKPGYEM